MENYEQKYKEALERARDLHDNHPLGQPQTWMTCEKIFPELRESEDERIRKELIERFKWELKGAEEQDAAGCNRQKDIAMFKRGIAWLEKQGEQKPADSYCQENCKGFKETGKCFADGDCKAKRDAEQNHIWSEEDYMCLPKERLAELLAERDNQPQKLVFPNQNNDYNIPCYAPNGVCVNPFRDCIDCPKMFGGGGYSTTSELQPNT